MLRGGVPASRVWRAMFAGDRSETAQGSRDLAGVRDGPAWRVILTAWHLALASGSPLAGALDRLAAALRALDRVAERRAVLLAAPRATIRLVAALPPSALVLGVALGFDPLPVLVSPFGVLLLLSGTALLLLGMCWARWLVARLAAVDCVVGLECELLGIALAGGASPAAAVRALADRADAAGAAWVRLDELRRDGPVFAILDLATEHGTPTVPLLRAEAEAQRARALSELEAAAERLGVRILLPIGICVLPAFVLLGVMPVLLAVLGGVMS